MSAAREVGGVKATCGRKPDPKYANHLTKAEQEILRQGLHDALRAAGHRAKRMEKPTFGLGGSKAPGAKRRRERNSPHSWHSRYLKALVRTGNDRRAAEAAGVAYSTVRRALFTNSVLREAHLDALTEYWGRISGRILRGVQRGAWMGARAIKAILRGHKKQVSALLTPGAEEMMDEEGGLEG